MSKKEIHYVNYWKYVHNQKSGRDFLIGLAYIEEARFGSKVVETKAVKHPCSWVFRVVDGEFVIQTNEDFDLTPGFNRLLGITRHGSIAHSVKHNELAANHYIRNRFVQPNNLDNVGLTHHRDEIGTIYNNGGSYFSIENESTHEETSRLVRLVRLRSDIESLKLVIADGDADYLQPSLDSWEQTYKEEKARMATQVSNFKGRIAVWNNLIEHDDKMRKLIADS